MMSFRGTLSADPSQRTPDGDLGLGSVELGSQAVPAPLSSGLRPLQLLAKSVNGAERQLSDL